jgi:hypothetical protein
MGIETLIQFSIEILSNLRGGPSVRMRDSINQIRSNNLGEDGLITIPTTLIIRFRNIDFVNLERHTYTRDVGE